MPRYTLQNQQEDKSRNQLGERFVEMGWILDPFHRDVGEDLHGRIYQNGESTGLSFDIQLKSCVNIERFKLKKINRYFYPVKVSDLLHWEVSASPVILLVWDVEERRGVWVVVSSAIEQLDKNGIEWRNNKNTRVTIPSDQNTSDKGFTLLRLQLLNESFSSISRWFFRKFRLQFPETEDSREDLKRFLEARKTGDKVEIDGRYIQLDHRDKRLLGPLLDWDWKFIMGSRPLEKAYPVKLVMESSDGDRAEIPYVEIRLVKKGEDLLTFSNAHEASFGVEERKGSPLRITLSQNIKNDVGMNFGFDNSGTSSSPAEIQKGIEFVNTFAKGGELTIEFLSIAHTVQNSVSAGITRPVPKIFQEYIEILRLIEEYSGCSFHLTDWKISSTDYDNIDLALALYSTGKAFLTDQVFYLNLDAAVLRSSKERLEQFLDDMASHGNWFTLAANPEIQKLLILGEEVCVGLCSIQTTGRLALNAEELRTKIVSSSEKILAVSAVQTFSVIEQHRQISEKSSQS